MTIVVNSSAFAEGERIPTKYTGDGLDVSPPLSWTGLPERTRELVLICDDPDAPSKEPWVHWVLYKITVSPPDLPEGIVKIARLKSPAGALQGKNSWSSGQTIGYRGPMPPPNHGEHRYFFRVYALRAKLTAQSGLASHTLAAEMAGHILDEGELMGTYMR
jgi:Raf kinase inhibitor-like YbhB/YbcL family protein